MTHKQSSLTPHLLWKLSLVAAACFFSLNIYADDFHDQKPKTSLRNQIRAQETQIHNAPNVDDFFVDWFDELADNIPDSDDAPKKLAKPKPLHGEDDTFFPIDDSEGRMPSSRLQNLIDSDLNVDESIPEEVRDDLEDWEEPNEATPAPVQTPTPTAPTLVTPKEKQQPLRRSPTTTSHSLLPPHSVQAPAEEPQIEPAAEQPILQAPAAQNTPEINAPTSGNQRNPAVPAAIPQVLPESHQKGLALYSPETEPASEGFPTTQEQNEDQKILINFNNVSIVEFIRFASRTTGKNFVFDENDLQFNVSVISEEPTTVSNIMTALMQELRIHGLTMIEQGNNVIIYNNGSVHGISKVVDQDGLSLDIDDSEIITQVFRLNTTEASAAAAVIKPLTSDVSVIDVIDVSNHLIVTDITANVKKISQLIKNLDSPKSGLVIGQYVVKNDYVDSLAENAKGILGPIAGDQSLSFIPHTPTNSIFIVGSPYLVEKSIEVMRYLDQNEGSTRVFNQQGKWVLDDNGQWVFRTGTGGDQPPTGGWYIDQDGNWVFRPGQPGSGQEPNGAWELDENGNWVYRLKPGQTIAARKLNRPETDRTEALPLGHIEKAQFTIYKLKYRKGDQVAEALQNIGATLQQADALNQDFVNAINTVQWIESSNSLIFTGTPMALTKVIEFIHEIDVPLRQVFIEMLIMDMTLTDSLIYGVNWGTQLGGGNLALGETFVSGVSQINNFLNSAAAGTPTTAPIANIPGYRLGVIGKHLSKGGVQFDTISALVKATHEDEDTRILMNPKIFTEENYAAEVFVGLEVQYPTQSIANDFGTLITQNYESKDIGTKLVVTPIIGNNDVITIEIHQEVSDIAGVATQVQSQTIANNAGPTIVKSTTTTRVHVPNGFFVAISGEIRDEERRARRNVPCLGAIPFLGAFFAEKENTHTKRNLMIFMRPQIIDTEEQFDNLAHHQQDVWQDASYHRKAWEYEVDEALDLMNLKTTLHQRYDGCDDPPCPE